MPRLASREFPLPKGWPVYVKTALLDAVAFGRLAMLNAASGFENSPLPKAQYAAETCRLPQLLALRDEECRILRARMACVPAAKRPQYPPAERLAILTARASGGWNAAETARRFLLTPKTISDWMRRLNEQGPDALVQLREPVNKFPDFVTFVVQQLHATVPIMGKLRIAETLARAGLKLSKTTIGRMMKRPLSPEKQTPETPKPNKGIAPANPVTGAETEAVQPEIVKKPKAPRTVTARYVHHVWHLDLSLLPTAMGFWVPWLPFTLPQCWPFCFWIAVVLDHYSRSVVAWRLFFRQPSATSVCRLLDDARDAAGRAPKYTVRTFG
jgi:transposase-like protein